MFHEKLIDELRSYYRTLSFHAVRTPFNPLKEEMDRFAEQNPGLSPLQLKAAQYEIIAEHFTPVLFRHDPFFYETGLKVAEYNGHTRLSSGGWLFLRNEHILRDRCPEEYAHYEQAGKLGLHLTYGFFDSDHHCFPFSRLLKLGLSGIAAELREARQKNNITQQELSEKSGVNRTNIAKIENGKYNVSIDILSKICNALDCDIIVKSKK